MSEPTVIMVGEITHMEPPKNAGNSTVCSFGVRCSRSWQGKTFNSVWWCSAWGGEAAKAGEFSNGDLVELVGGLRSREYNGTWKTEVNVRSIERIGAPKSAPVTDDDDDINF